MKKREFELKIGLFITEDNYDDLLKVYDQAVKTKSKRFPFRNKEEKLYAIETDYLTFVLDKLGKSDLDELQKKTNEYKLTEALTEEQIKEKKKLSQPNTQEKDDEIFTFVEQGKLTKDKKKNK